MRASFKREPEEVDSVDEDSIIRLEAEKLSDIVRFLDEGWGDEGMPVRHQEILTE